MIEIPVPVRLLLEVSAIGQNAVRARSRKGRHAAAARLVRHFKRPTAPCMGMIAAIRAQWPQLEVHRAAGVLNLESDVGGIASVGHPSRLLDPSISPSIVPTGSPPAIP